MLLTVAPAAAAHSVSWMVRDAKTLSTVSVGEFVLVALVAASLWIRHRERAIAWSAISFTTLATIGVVGQILSAHPTRLPPEWILKALIIGLLLIPFAFFRFAASFIQPPRWVRRLAAMLTVAVVATTVVAPPLPLPGRPEPFWFQLYKAEVCCQWAFLFTFVAARLWVAGSHQPTAVRYRMRLLATGAAGIDVQVIVGALGFTARPAAALASQVLSVAMAVFFLLGLVMPPMLRRSWGRRERDSFRSALADLVGATSAEGAAAGLLPHVAALVGASRVDLVDESGATTATYGRAADAASDHPDRSSTEVELRFGRGHHLAVWTSAYTPFFGRYELAMLSGVADLLGLAMERYSLAEREKDALHVIAHQALHDGLTGLPNRTLFLDRLAQGIAGLDRHLDQLAVMFVDLDHFKLINDGIDHAAGDAVLVEIAARLSAGMRAGDTVARFGGDEFVVLAEVRGSAEAIDLGHRILAAIASPVWVNGRDTVVTGSVGIVMAQRGADPVALLRDADAAMYRAKDGGRNRVEVFDPELRRRATERLELERDLRRALVSDELCLSYQPTFRLADGGIEGAEALVRWAHPQRGLLMPEEFIPIAEEFGLIRSVDEWVLRHACSQTAEWKRRGVVPDSFVVWVNMSAAQFQRSDPNPLIREVLSTTGLPPSALGLEITETVWMADDGQGALQALKRLGIHIAIDDFGTGFSSLGYLKRFAVDLLKVDRSFVSGIGREPETSLVTASRALARSLDIASLAEGVETEEQHRWLAAAGCDFAQGYYLAPPLDADTASAFFAEGFRPRDGFTAPVSAAR